MKIRALTRRLPWLIPLLVGCGGDDVAGEGGEGGTESTTGDETGETTMSTTTAPPTTGVDTTGDVNAAPQAVDDVVFATQDTALVVAAADGVLLNDADPDADPLTVAAFDAMSMAGGSVEVAADGGLDYTPAAGFWGTDQFEYTVQDDAGETASATVTVYVAPVQIPLGDVTAGMGGFVMDGEAEDDQSGAFVRQAGDVNGDGMDDLFVGAPLANGNAFDSGRSYVVFGKPDTEAVELSAIAAGIGGFVLEGEMVNDRAGAVLAGAGDVNGDGLDDLIVGAPGADPNGSESGRSYVVFGKADTAAVELSAITAGMGGFVLNGEAGGDGAASVSGAGDVNGDGLDDLIVGAPGADPNGSESGRSYVVFGKADTAAVELGTITAGIGGFVLEGEATNHASGRGVSGAGDVNGDGLDDLIVGAWGAAPNGSNSGRSYVVFGKADTAAVQLSTITTGMGGFVLNGEAADDSSGESVRNAGDVNGDGLDDVVVGASFASPNGDGSGRSYVVFGKADTAAVELTDITAGMGGFVMDGEAAGHYSGNSAGGAGDVNGDGLADIIVGALEAGRGSGRSYVVLGKANTEAVELSAITAGMGGFVLEGEMADRAGRSVSGAGDVNGDGTDDIIVGAFQADPNGEASGRSYVVFGVPTAAR